MHIYKYALIDLDLLLRLAQNCKKYTFLDNLRTIIQEGNMEIRQLNPFFLSSFSLKLTFIFVFKNSQNSLSCGPPFAPFWSEIPQFWEKAINADNPS